MAIPLFYLMQGEGKKDTNKPKFTTEEYLIRVGLRIKELRIKKGYKNYEHFAYAHNISRAQFGRYENGQDLKFSSLVKVVEAFDMTLEEFFSQGF